MSTPETDIPTDHNAPLDVAHRLGLARFRAKPLALPWLSDALRDGCAEVVRLTRDLAEARAAIAADLHCDECPAVATRRHHDPARKHGGDDYACDAHSVAPEASADEHWSDLPHAAAVRAAQVQS